MEILGFFLAILIGVLLSLIGGGGSILTVPLLVYIFNIDGVLSTTYSLFLVGSTSAIGAFSYYKKKQIDFKSVVIFGVPAVITVFLTRSFLLPKIPDQFSILHLTISKSVFLVLIFAFLMVFAGISMLYKKVEEKGELSKKSSLLFVLIEGIIVGVLTGLVGAGGGFLIIPALVIYSGLPMKTAVGTSLAIIAFKSLIGFAGSISSSVIDWHFLLLLSLLSVIGILIGSKLNNNFKGNTLQKYFGIGVIVMGSIIIVLELLKVN